MINTDKYLPVQLPTTGLHSSGKLLVRTGKTGTEIDGAGKGYFGVDYVLSAPKPSKASLIWAGFKAFFSFGKSSTKKLEKSSVQWVKVRVQDDKNPNNVATVYLNVAQINGSTISKRVKIVKKPDLIIGGPTEDISAPNTTTSSEDVTSWTAPKIIQKKSLGNDVAGFYSDYMPRLRETRQDYEGGIEPNRGELRDLLRECREQYKRFELNCRQPLQNHKDHAEYLGLMKSCKAIFA